MSGPYDIFIAAGQSNMFAGYSDPAIYFDNVTDRVPGPHLYQYRLDGTIATATQGLDFITEDAANLASYAVYFCRDYYIPQLLSGGRDVLIIPAAQGGTGFAMNWAGASFTGTGSGTNLTASAVTGYISFPFTGLSVGALIQGTGVPANTTIVSQTSGTPGGAGVYVTNNATTSSGAALTAGLTSFEAMVSLINGALAHDAGNVLKGIFWQHGEEDVGDFGAIIGRYATQTLSAGYNQYMTDLRAILHSRVTGGFNQVPIFLGGLIPDTCWGPTADVSAYSPNYPIGIGLSADGLDHHNSANATMFGIQSNMPNVISNCLFVDSLNPTKLVAQAASNPILNSTYWFHYAQASHRELAHRAFMQYRRINGLGTPIAAKWGT